LEKMELNKGIRYTNNLSHNIILIKMDIKFSQNPNKINIKNLTHIHLKLR